MPQTLNCWANALDDCHGKLTREHVISVAAVPHDDPNAGRQQKEQVIVQHRSYWGPRSWTREVKVRDLASRMLCEGHNQGSSELDAAGGTCHAALRMVHKLATERRFTRLRWATRSFDLDGELVERWLMKETVNMVVGFREHKRIGSETSKIDQPTKELSEMIFGRRPVAEPFGIWLLSPPTSTVLLEDAITVYEWGSKAVVHGALFSLHGFRFAVSLADEDPPWKLFCTMTGWRTYQSVRYFREIRNDGIGASLVFRWKTSLPTVSVTRGRTVGADAPIAH